MKNNVINVVSYEEVINRLKVESENTDSNVAYVNSDQGDRLDIAFNIFIKYPTWVPFYDEFNSLWKSDIIPFLQDEFNSFTFKDKTYTFEDWLYDNNNEFQMVGAVAKSNIEAEMEKIDNEEVGWYGLVKKAVKTVIVNGEQFEILVAILQY